MRSERRSREGKRESKGKERSSRLSSSPRRNSLEGGTPTGYSPSGTENQPTCFALQRVIVPKGLLVIPVIHDSVLFVKQGILNMRVSARLSTRKKLGGRRGEPKKRNNSVVVAKTWDYTQAQDKITSLEIIAKGDLLHSVSYPVTSICRDNGEEYGQ